jgi:hypothetical protein
MPQNAFKNGYLAGWRSIRGSEEPPEVPAYQPGAGNPYREGVAQGVRDAGALAKPSGSGMLTGRTILSFTPEQIDAVRAAYEKARVTLELSCTSDRFTGIVITKIMELAKAGEFDPQRLADAALAHLPAETSGIQERQGA